MMGERTRPAIHIIVGLLLGLLALTLTNVQSEELKVPSEDQCRPYIEKALKDLGTEGSQEQGSAEVVDELSTEDMTADRDKNNEKLKSGEKQEFLEEKKAAEADTTEVDEGEEYIVDQEQMETVEISSTEAIEIEVQIEKTVEKVIAEFQEKEKSKDNEAEEFEEKQNEKHTSEEGEIANESIEAKTEEATAVESEESNEQRDKTSVQKDTEIQKVEEASFDTYDSIKQKTKVTEEEESQEKQNSGEETPAAIETEEGSSNEAKQLKEQQAASVEYAANEEEKTKEENEEKTEENIKLAESIEEHKKSVEKEVVVEENTTSIEQKSDTDKSSLGMKKTIDGTNSEEKIAETEKNIKSRIEDKEAEEETKSGKEPKDDEFNNSYAIKFGKSEEGKTEEESESEKDEELRPEEEELIMEIVIPEVLRPRDHIAQLLKLDEESEEKEKAVEIIANVVLRDLKRLYDNAIKPLETLYKYRDLSNRHFGDPEIFSKPLVLFMGPWSGGKSSIINYLLDIEYQPTSLRTGAEPSPAYFNIVMHGEEEEILDGTQLAADWTFSGLQKFGQGLLDRLKGYKLKSKLLEKVNIVEIPGILEIRKQVQRLFPFNDACQWFIDRADIIFLVYDPSKLDVGPETEAILDQLKGREYQTRIVLNKADQVKPEELMRVQGALIWNISPLMSSAEPPIMYSASLWSIPFETGAPTRLLHAQERAFLRDLRSAIDKKVEHKIASARRFAVRVRNHAKMVDCYLTTYYNHKSFFAKKKDISDRIIENPQDYHIYEGLSTLTNISRYDLPDPDVYRDFFRLNSLYDFPLLSSTCTYFRGCPINRLDIAIAYDLPELVGKYKKSVDAAQYQVSFDTPGDVLTTTTTAGLLPSQKGQKSTSKSSSSKMTLS